MKSLLTTFAVVAIGTSAYMACSDVKEPEVPVESAAVTAGSGTANGEVETGANLPESGNVGEEQGNQTEVPKENPDETIEDVPNGSSPGPSPENDPANLPPDTSGGAPAPAPEPTPVPPQSADPVPVPTPATPGTPPPAPAPTPAPAPVFAANCAQIKETQAGAQTGISTIFINPNDPATRRSIDAFCDQDVDGGGWTLFLNYVHKAATNPALNIRNNTLPVIGSSVLGTDESPQARLWGHASNAMLRNFEIKELRFFCKSSRQANVVIDFRTTDPGCINYAKTGQGSCGGVTNAFAALPGHNASIPALLDSGGSNAGNLAMTNDTLSRILSGTPDPPDPSWSIKGGANAQNWECDFGSNDAASDTIHRMYFR